MEEVTFGKYKLRSIPTPMESIDDTHESLMLEFQDFWKEGQLSSNPEKEGDYALSLLSLVNGMKAEFTPSKLTMFKEPLERNDPHS